MSVTRCSKCGRGLAGYLGGEKEWSDLTLDEVGTEIPKYEAKATRIRSYMSDVSAETVAPATYLDGKACPDCGFGWREFDKRRKDLEQLTSDQARSALGANSNWLKELRRKESLLTGTASDAAASSAPPADVPDV